MKRSLLLAFWATLTLQQVSGQSKPTGFVSGSGFVKIISATSQEIRPGRQEQDPFTDYRITLVWRSQRKPESFFWKPDGAAWMTSLANRKKGAELQEISLKQINKGDTLVLVPMRMGRDVPPHRLPAVAPRLYFKIAQNPQWYYSAVRLKKLTAVNAQ